MGSISPSWIALVDDLSSFDAKCFFSWLALFDKDVRDAGSRDKCLMFGYPIVVVLVVGEISSAQKLTATPFCKMLREQRFRFVR